MSTRGNSGVEMYVHIIKLLYIPCWLMLMVAGTIDDRPAASLSHADMVIREIAMLLVTFVAIVLMIALTMLYLGLLIWLSVSIVQVGV